MPRGPEETSEWNALLLRVGQLEGHAQSMGRELKDQKASIHDLYTKANETHAMTARIEQQVSHIAASCDVIPSLIRQVDALERKVPGTDTVRKAKDKNPLNMSLGELGGWILVQAIKVVGVGAVVAAIVYFVGGPE